ncbi:hypothetical protein SUNI508_10916 [Seiridium unicorne]|uniref:Uncharacterized protein n=1 Tax=Seiridium unicorne TaxID=138068 RepID=A0ABR2UJL0_9PEZI
MFATRPIVRCVVWRDLRPRKYERGARALSARVGITIMYLVGFRVSKAGRTQGLVSAELRAAEDRDTSTSRLDGLEPYLRS